MTKDEFNRWKNAYFIAFPDTNAWLNKQPDPQATLATWFKCLSRCEIGDVAVATDRMICGELAPVDAFNREQTAILVRAYAGRIADDRKRLMKQSAEHHRYHAGREAVRNERGPGVASMFKQILKFREDGESRGLSGKDLSEWASDQLELWLRENANAVAVETGDTYEEAR